VTLGSLINFCDCLMCGGTSRRDHSEVGSSYIHFNYTPEGDKTTASLIGDVPRGVMLNQPPIFLGGQGGIVGPVRMGFGNVVAADSVLRADCLEDNRLIVGRHPAPRTIPYVPRAYPNLRRIVENNLVYMANLAALDAWYAHVRRPFFDAQEFGPLLLAAAREAIALGLRERLLRLRALAGKVKTPPAGGAVPEEDMVFRKAFSERFPAMEPLFAPVPGDGAAEASREEFLSFLAKGRGAGGGSYVEAIQGLPAEASRAGTAWLRGIVDSLCGRAAEAMPSSGLFGR
jgi:UDP-N-acetylglucosamine/UDP-N-acetylgalactosamine diphosphorylase